MRVYPAPGLKVRDPISKELLTDEGREVSEIDPFWARRLFQGDVVTEKPAITNPSDDTRNSSAIARLTSSGADSFHYTADNDAETGSDV